MSDINDLRNKMDKVTLEMINLLKTRTDIAKEIGKVKKTIGKVVTDEEREDNLRGKIIKVSNWWNWEGKGSADLYLDDEHLDQNTDMLVNPNEAMLSKSEVSDDIKSIEVFSAGVFSVKLSIMVNGVVVLQDKLSLLRLL